MVKQPTEHSSEFQMSSEDIPHDDNIVFDIVHSESEHGQILGQQSLAMPLYDVRMILFQQMMHLLDLFTCKRLDDILLVMGNVELGPRLAGVVHGFGSYAHGINKLHVINTKPFPQVSEHNWTVFLDFKVTWQVFFIKGLVVYLNF